MLKITGRSPETQNILIKPNLILEIQTIEVL